jgi:hypothetical protein
MDFESIYPALKPIPFACFATVGSPAYRSQWRLQHS